MIVNDITRVIEDFAPLGIQEKWDNSGLLIGSPETPVHSVLVGFDCTPELVGGHDNHTSSPHFRGSEENIS